MPNWVTNKVTAPSHVIESMLNVDSGVDFSNIEPFPGEFPWDHVNIAAEQLSEIVVGRPLSDNPMIARLEAANRARTRLEDLGDEAFEQFLQMLRNHRKCRFFHQMDFARERWGTKWNACDSSADVVAGTASFETAWSCPMPVFLGLSKKFPADRIDVKYADEDIGSNCGMFALLGGEVIESNVAPMWRDQTDAQKAFWRGFACELTGRDPKDYEED
ncbi:hypothetical protein [Pandoraea pnomenusa]|uniref:DUF1281 family ferredoxin-like fold protein n=1 Tax=Pandoraea pnomenusa TaxID=93220 RepID=UPI003340974C